MKKKLLVVFLICCFMASAMPMQALASQKQSKETLLIKLIIIMQRALQASDRVDELTEASLRTQIFLNDILIALTNKDNKQLKTIVDNYVSDMAVLQQDIPINPQCLLSLWGIFGEISSIVNALSAGGETACVTAAITINIGNIISAIQSYRICQIIFSETPDQALCQQIVQRQTIIKTCNYIALAFNIFFCTEAPAASDYLRLVFGLIGIFPSTDACTPPAPAA
jgi:hypothetical protein